MDMKGYENTPLYLYTTKEDLEDSPHSGYMWDTVIYVMHALYVIAAL